MSEGKAFTNQLLQEVTNVFRFFDTDQDGVLSPIEAVNVWQKFGLTVNVNMLPKDKKVDLDFFLEKLAVVHFNSDLEAHLHQVFTILDRSNKGYLVPEDFMDYFTDCGEAPEKKFILELCELIAIVDDDDEDEDAEKDKTTETESKDEEESEEEEPKLKFSFHEFYEWIKKEQRRKNKKKMQRQ